MKFLITLLTIVIIVGCSKDIKDYKISEMNDEIRERVKKELTDEEQELLKGGAVVFALSMGGDSTKIAQSNKTIGNLIEDQRKLKNKLQKEKEEKEAKARQDSIDRANLISEMNDHAMIKVLDKGYIKQGYEDYISLEYQVENKSDKTINGVKFIIEMTNMFDEDLGRYSISIDDPIKSKSNFKKTGYWDYNQFDKENKRLLNTDFDKITFNAYPYMIIFDDGKKLTLDE